MVLDGSLAALNQWVPDKSEAEVVRELVQIAGIGDTSARIAYRVLNDGQGVVLSQEDFKHRANAFDGVSAPSARSCTTALFRHFTGPKDTPGPPSPQPEITDVNGLDSGHFVDTAIIDEEQAQREADEEARREELERQAEKERMMAELEREAEDHQLAVEEEVCLAQQALPDDEARLAEQRRLAQAEVRLVSELASVREQLRISIQSKNAAPPPSPNTIHTMDQGMTDLERSLVRLELGFDSLVNSAATSAELKGARKEVRQQHLKFISHPRTAQLNQLAKEKADLARDKALTDIRTKVKTNAIISSKKMIDMLRSISRTI